MARSLSRPYRLQASMVFLLALVPGYLVIAREMPGRAVHRPELGLDRLWPVVPTWALIYGALYLYLILLPLFVVRDEERLRRTFRAYLAIWVTAFACFLLFPTIGPRPGRFAGEGFAAWGLRFLYEADPPYNCFPSLHVAHSFVSAFACGRVHRGTGRFAVACAALVGLSTLFTKQHYVLDVLAGVGLAVVAWALFLRGPTPEQAPGLDRQAAPLFAQGLLVALGMAVGGAWVVYLLRA